METIEIPRLAPRVLFCIFLAGLLPSGFATGEAPAPVFDQARTELAWHDDSQRQAVALREAEAFRQRLLETSKPKLASASKASALGQILVAFRQSVVPPAGRPDLSRFTVTADQFCTQLQGHQTVLASQAFLPFAGRWYGVWNGREVDHHWTDVATEARLEPIAKSLALKPNVGTQYAWIGDGFGWNFLVHPQHATGDVILGHVFHTTRDEPSVVTRQYPLVGYADGPGRVIWITPDHLFFEEVHTATEQAGECYSITGSRYQSRANCCQLIGKPFQAIYTRQPEVRPDWIEFSLSTTHAELKQ